MTEDIQECLYLSETASIVKFKATAEAVKKKCVLMFSAFNERTLCTKLGGTNPLIRTGYDVICFQTNKYDWHQSLPESFLQQLSHDLHNEYTELLAYGSSMGGYAALTFASLFKCSRVYAIAPQFTITEEFDKRWIAHGKKIKWNYNLFALAHEYHGEVFIAYDPLSLDAAHYRKISKAFINATVTPFPIKHPGHFIAKWLKDADLLKSAMFSILEDGAVPSIEKHHYRGNKTYNLEISKKLLRKNKIKTALRVALMNLELNDNSHLLFRHLSGLYNRLGEYENAFHFAQKAVEAADNAYVRTHHMEHLAKLLNTAEKHNEALDVINQAIANTPETDYRLFERKSYILSSLMKYKQAILFAERAVEEGGTSHLLFRHLSNMHKRTGNINSAVNYAKQAVNVADSDTIRARHLAYLANLLRMDGKFDEALTAITKAKELMPNSEQYSAQLTKFQRMISIAKSKRH